MDNELILRNNLASARKEKHLSQSELAKLVGADPAIMATPFITTIVDAGSLIIYFHFAELIFASEIVGKAVT